MTEYKVWAFARSAAPNLPALEEQLAEKMDRWVYLSDLAERIEKGETV